MDQTKRAEAALRLLRHTIAIDDQACFDLISGVCESEELFREFEDDDGRAYASVQEFLGAVATECNKSLGSGVVASASAGRPRRMTPEERYQARLALHGQGTE